MERYTMMQFGQPNRFIVAQVVVQVGEDGPLEIVAEVREPANRSVDWPHEAQMREDIRQIVGDWRTLDTPDYYCVWLVFDPGRDQIEEEILGTSAPRDQAKLWLASAEIL